MTVALTELEDVGATGLVTSGDGTVAALVSPDRVRFFSIQADEAR